MYKLQLIMTCFIQWGVLNMEAVFDHNYYRIIHLNMNLPSRQEVSLYDGSKEVVLYPRKVLNV